MQPCHHFGISQTLWIPILGWMCPSCYEKAARPMLLDGVVGGPSLKELCESTDKEFAGRTEKLLKMAEVVFSQ